MVSRKYLIEVFVNLVKAEKTVEKHYFAIEDCIALGR